MEGLVDQEWSCAESGSWGIVSWILSLPKMLIKLTKRCNISSSKVLRTKLHIT